MSLGTLYFFFDFGTTAAPAPAPAPVTAPVSLVGIPSPALPVFGIEDEDVLEGVQAYWLASPTLAGIVPGGLHAGRIVSTPPMPYAHAACEQGPTPNAYHTPTKQGGGYQDYRHLTITLHGREPDLPRALGAVRALLEWQPKGAVPLTIPNAVLKRVMPIPGTTRLEIDPVRRQGDDLWRAVAEYELWTVRTIPQHGPRAPLVSAVGSGSEDRDTLEAFRALWLVDPYLTATVPAAPVFGRVPPPKDAPLWARVECRQGPRPNEVQASASPGVGYHDFRQVTVTVTGRKPDVVRATGYVRAAFEWADDLVIPGALRFLRCMPLAPTPHLEQEPTMRRGDDLWRGICQYEVWSIRSIP